MKRKFGPMGALIRSSFCRVSKFADVCVRDENQVKDLLPSRSEGACPCLGGAGACLLVAAEARPAADGLGILAHGARSRRRGHFFNDDQ